jgi:hypothetical protein
MANLLPLSQKKIIHTEYKTRLSVVSFVFLLFLIFAAIMMLSPAYILSSFKLNNASARLAGEKKRISDSVTGEDPIKVTKEINAKLSLLGQEEFLVPKSYDLFTIVVGHKPDNVKIYSIFYDRDTTNGIVSVSGVAKNRKTLLSFLQSLEKEKKFTSVKLPISSFVEGEDIKFSIKIGIEEEIENEKNNKNEK